MPKNPVYVNSLTDCIAACASTTGCIDVSLSGRACYLKSKLTTAKAQAAILGARKVVSSTSSASATATPVKMRRRVRERRSYLGGRDVEIQGVEFCLACQT